LACDQIGISGIDAITGGTDDAFTFVGAFSSTVGEAVIQNIWASFSVIFDVNGDCTADMEIFVQGVTLVAGDFIL
jgi:hypothetical protein